MAQKDHTKALTDISEATKKGSKLSEVKPFEIYCLRHSFLTNLAESGCDAFTLAKIAGHSSVTITARYCHPEQDSVERAIRVMVGSQKVVTDGGH